MAKDALLYYPNFNKRFDIHTDSSDYQLGAIISQKKRPIAYWSKQLSATQIKCVATDQDLLAIEECLKQYKSMLLGQHITA